MANAQSVNTRRSYASRSPLLLFHMIAAGRQIEVAEREGVESSDRNALVIECVKGITDPFMAALCRPSGFSGTEQNVVVHDVEKQLIDGPPA
jgi:hypothetical protein